jgi:predicted RND superfamily exporter protein
VVALTRRAALGWVVLHALLAAVLVGRLAGATTDSRPQTFLAPDDPVRARHNEFRAAFGDDPFLVVTGSADGLSELEDVDAVLPLATNRWLVRLGRRGPAAVDAVADVCLRNGASLSGQPALRVALDREAQAVGEQLLPIVVLLMAILLWLSYRSIAVVVAVLLTTGAGVLWGMGVVVTAPLNLLTVLLPVLLFALGTALCIHLIHAFRRTGDIHEMIRETVRPCLVTSLTTAVGFGSLAFARVAPLRILGLSMAAGILGMFVLAFTLLPALLYLFRPRPRDGIPVGRWLERVVPPLVARPRIIGIVTLATLIAAAALVPTIPTETNGLQYLPASHPLRVATEELQQAGFGATSIEFRLDELPPDLLVVADRIRALGPPVRRVISPADLPAQAMRGFVDPNSGAVRLSVRCDYMGVGEYEQLRARLREILDVEPTGDLPLAMAVQGDLLTTLIRSLGGTAAIILLLLVAALRSMRLALLTLAPALVPMAVVVIVSAVCGFPVSIATVMVLAVSLGIVTDDSIHVVHAWRKGKPLAKVLHEVGTAVTETSAVIAVGFFVCSFAGFLPTRHFGILTGTAMVVALFADLVLFPVLLGPPRKMTAETTPA